MRSYLDRFKLVRSPEVLKVTFKTGQAFNKKECGYK